MTPDAEAGIADIPTCWCCGAHCAEHDLVRLGAHPEVGVCLDCAHGLRRRARGRHDEVHPTRAGQLRRALHTLREQVISCGWHEHGRLGTVLRCLDRHLP